MSLGHTYAHRMQEDNSYKVVQYRSDGGKRFMDSGNKDYIAWKSEGNLPAQEAYVAPVVVVVPSKLARRDRYARETDGLMKNIHAMQLNGEDATAEIAEWRTKYRKIKTDIPLT